MKNYLALTLSLAMVFFAASLQAGVTKKDKKSKAVESDRTEVCRTLNYYFEGANFQSVNAVRNACHPDANITHLNTKTGQVESLSLDTFLDQVKMDSRWTNRSLKLLDLEIEGNAAMAKIKVSQLDSNRKPTIEYLSLVKNRGEWQIIRLTTYQKS